MAQESVAVSPHAGAIHNDARLGLRDPLALHPRLRSQEEAQGLRRAEVPHLWFVDPISKSIDVLRLSGDLYSIVDTFGGDDKARIEPFEAIELDLTLLWLPDSPPAE